MSKEDLLSPRWVTIIQSVEKKIEQKMEEGQIFCLLLNWNIHLFPAFGHQSSWSLNFRTLGLPRCFPSPAHNLSQAFGLILNYSASFPGSPVCRGQIMGFLSFYNYKCVCVCVCMCVCVCTWACLDVSDTVQPYGL